MRSRSPKGAARDREYAKARKLFLANVTECEIGHDGCTGRATQVHHVVNRSQARELIANPRNFCGSCEPCHMYVTDHPDWAKEMGFTVQVGPGRAMVRELEKSGICEAPKWDHRIIDISTDVLDLRCWVDEIDDWRDGANLRTTP